jgi:DNA-binding transcriptional regulator YiaG
MSSTMLTKTAMALAKVRDLTSSGEAKRLRVEVGDLSLAEVADVAHVAPVTIWRWERGLKRPHGVPARRYLRLLEELAAAERENGHG